MGIGTEETRMPSPKTGEQQSKFIQRCMSSNESQKSFPEQKQRVAFCHSQWKNKGKSSGAIFVYKDPITSELFHFSRQGVYKKNGRILIFVKRSRGEIMSDHILNRAAKSHADEKSEGLHESGLPKNLYNKGGKVCPKGQKWDSKVEKCLPVEENDAEWNFKKKDDDEEEKDDKDKKKNGKNGDKNGKNGDKKKKDNPFKKKG